MSSSGRSSSTMSSPWAHNWRAVALTLATAYASLQQRAGCRGRHDLRELVLEVDAGHFRDFGGRYHLAILRGDVERVGRVEDEPHVVPEVGADASGRLPANVRLNPAHRDRADPALAQPCVEIDISVKRRVHCLDNAQIGLAGDGLFQLEAGRAALERSTRPIVLNDDERLASPAPCGNQLGNVLLGIGVVAGPERRIFEAALNVDHHQRTLPGHASEPMRISFLLTNSSAP